MSTFESKLIEENQKLLKKLDQQTQLLTSYDQKIFEQDQTIQQLTEQVEFLSKKLFGSSSEKTKVDPGQLTLFGDPVLEEPLTKDEPTEEITYRRRKTSGRKAELTKDLPIEEVHCELHGEDCTCDHCGQAMKPMGKPGVDAVLAFPEFDQPRLFLVVEIDREGVEDHLETGRHIVIEPRVAGGLLPGVYGGGKETAAAVIDIAERSRQFLQHGTFLTFIHTFDPADDLFSAEMTEDHADKRDQKQDKKSNVHNV